MEAHFSVSRIALSVTLHPDGHNDYEKSQRHEYVAIRQYSGVVRQFAWAQQNLAVKRALKNAGQ